MKPRDSNRRMFLKTGTGAALLTGRNAAPQSNEQPAPDDPSKVPGSPVRAYGERSRFERIARRAQGDSSSTPLQDLTGIITPSSLHFERHHAGVPDIDPRRHRLLIHGMV